MAASIATVANVVLRGDLLSDSGFGRHTRALAQLLAPHAQSLYGVSLFEHPSRTKHSAPFPLIPDSEIATLDEVVVVNFCAPPSFRRFENAFNVGYFSWETDAFPPGHFWPSYMKLMDRLWFPTSWQSRVFAARNDSDLYPVITWQQQLPISDAAPIAVLERIAAYAPMTPEETRSFLLRSTPSDFLPSEIECERMLFEAGESSRFETSRFESLPEVFAKPGDVFLAIQTDVPRKGLPLLLTSWFLFKREAHAKDAKLIIKITSIDVSSDLYRTHFNLSVAINRAMTRLGAKRSDIYVVHDHLNDEEMRSLIASSDAFVSATMGEGFGGPMAECLLEGTPYIGPVHTSCADFIADDYPLEVSSESKHLKLWNNLDVYSPAAPWYVVDTSDFARRLSTFSRMPRVSRDMIVDAARSHLLKQIGIDSVRQKMADEMQILVRARASAVA